MLRRYRYLFDLSGNRTQEIATVGTATTTTDYEYTAANQIYRRRVNAGAWTNFSYDNNGNLTNDGANTYGWDRANRLNQRGLNYTYDGYGNRFQGDVTKYLLDIQPGLSEVIREEDTGSHGGFYGPPYFVHGSRGLHAFNRVNSGSGARYWTWPLEDGLGSVRVNVDSTGGVLESRNYDPYGNGFNPTGTSQTNYGFTGEPTDSNGLLYLRTRFYNPAVGVFTALDPFEGFEDVPMSLNGYSWVEGNVPNFVDPSGECGQPTNWLDPVDANCFYSADGLARRFSEGDSATYQSLFNYLIQKSWGELKYIEAVGSTSNLLNNASIIPNLFYQNPEVAWQALMQWNSGCANSSSSYAYLGFLSQGYNPNLQQPTNNQGGGGAGLLIIGAISLVLGAFAVAGAISRSQTSNVYEYRLRGFDKKLGTLAEHLAKLLNREVAGYPKPDPNPQGDPNRGWCITIRNKITEIREAKYSESQLARDLEKAGISDKAWGEILKAIADVIEWKECDDYWDNFNGGGPLTTQ